MTWESGLFDLFDDLEAQAQAAFEVDREADLADRARAEYAGVDLLSRLMASVGNELALDLVSLGRVEGVLKRVGAGWCLVRGAGEDWIVPQRHIISVQGAADRSGPQIAWSPVDKLGLRSAFRRVCEAGEPVILHLVDGSTHEAGLLRVGADFFEAECLNKRALLVPYDAVVAVRSRERG